MRIHINWIPYPGAWLSAVLLLLLTGLISFAMKAIIELGIHLTQSAPDLAILLSLAVILMPILVVAIAHHGLHLFLDRFFPESKPTEQDAAGFFPGLMSWWEGLYGWLVMVLVTLSTSALCSFFLGSQDSSYLVVYTYFFNLLSAWDKTRYIFTIPAVIWIVIAAYFYQFEHLVHRHLMSQTPSR